MHFKSFSLCLEKISCHALKFWPGLPKSYALRVYFSGGSMWQILRKHNVFKGLVLVLGLSLIIVFQNCGQGNGQNAQGPNGPSSSSFSIENMASHGTCPLAANFSREINISGPSFLHQGVSGTFTAVLPIIDPLPNVPTGSFIVAWTWTGKANSAPELGNPLIASFQTVGDVLIQVSV